jgi:two-component system, OmpR family, phosphate regulon sensor histidine kinase PhoR
MRRRTLFWQVFPAYVLLTVGLLLFLWLESKGRLRDFYEQQTSENLAASAALFAESAKAPLEQARYDEVDLLAKRLGKASRLRITAVLPDGRVVAESEENPAFMDSHRTRPEIADALDTRAVAHDVRHSNTLQQDFFYVALPLLRNGQPWAVVRVSMPATAVNEALKAFEQRIVYGSLMAAVIIVALSWLVTRRISRPLEAITRGAERFGRGELDYRLPVDGSREIATLADTLNDMAVRLAEQIQTIAVQRSEEEAVLLSMEEGVLTLDNQGRILNLNRAAGQMFQLDPEKTRGRPIHEALRKADVLKFVEAALSRPLPLQEDIVIYDKEKRFLTAYGNALCNARHQQIGILVVFRDVTELRRLGEAKALRPSEGR